MFKKYLLIFLLIFGLAFGTAAVAIAVDSVAMEWTPNNEGDLIGYRLYRSTQSGQYTYGTTSPNFVDEIPCGPNDSSCANYIDLNLSEGTYYWVLTAIDSEGYESGPSNEVTKTIDPPYVGTPPNAPTNLRFP